MTVLLPGIFLFWSGTMYELQQGSYRHKTISYCLQRHFACFVVDFWVFCSNISDVAGIGRPHPDYWSHGTLRTEVQLYFSLFTWPWRAFECNRRCCCASRYNFDPLNVIAFISEVSSFDYNNHLHRTSACKSLVASCVCVAETLTHIFNIFISIAKYSSPVQNAFISSVKSVHSKHQKCLSPAQKAFVASNKHVCLQCDSYLDLSSRDYLVAKKNQKVGEKCFCRNFISS